MAFSLTAIIRAFVAPSHRLRCSPQLWRGIVAKLERRGEGRHEAGAFLLGVDDAGQKEVREAVFYDDLDHHAYDTGVCVLHGDAFARLWSLCREKNRSAKPARIVTLSPSSADFRTPTSAQSNLHSARQPSHPTSRAFLHWRLSDDGRGASRIVPVGRRPKPFTFPDEMQGSKHHSIKSSARAITVPGMVSPSAVAVSRLMFDRKITRLRPAVRRVCRRYGVRPFR
jgi:hypothetical protein